MATMNGDKITGTSKKDTINWVNFYTYYRDLTVKAGSGNDIINFKKSKYKNKLYGDAGKDSIYGGKGKDYIYGGKGSDKLYGYNGNDVIKGGKGNDYINGGKGNDKLYGEYGANTIKGGSGNDTIFGGTGNDSIIAGSGHDRIDLSKGGLNTVSGGSGDDQVKGSDNADNINGDSGNDTIDGKLGNDTIYGGTGDDKLWGGYGNDKVYGNEGNDTIYAGSDNDYVDGGDGNDSINGYSGNNTLLGGNGADTIIGGSGNDYIDGGAGNDVITNKSYGGNNTVLGGAGNDSITAGKGTDKITGGQGNDTLYGGSGKATYIFNIGDGKDTIYAGTGVDTIELPADAVISDDTFTKVSNNLVIKYSSDDQITLYNYFNGNHSVKYYKVGEGETQSILNATIYTKGSGDINGTDYKDNIVGSDSADTITAGSAKNNLEDSVTPGKGNDTVNIQSNGRILITAKNGDGNDTVTGAADAANVVLALQASQSNSLYGQQVGSNYVITRRYDDKTETITLKDFNYEASKDKVFIRDIATSTDKPLSFYNNSPEGQIEQRTENGSFVADDDNSYHVIGDAGSDVITTNNGDDFIEAGDGDNKITTSGGSNTINTGTGDDTISVTGGSGENIVSSVGGNNNISVTGSTTDVTTGSGNDTISVSGTESNTVTATDGNNRITATTGNNTITTGSGADTITFSGSGENHINAGDGNNEINVNSTGSSTVDGGSGIDRINVTSGNNTIRSGAGSDIITLGGSSSNNVDAGSGSNDISINSTGSSTVAGGIDSDKINVTAGTNNISTGGGDDVVNLSGGNNTLDIGNSAGAIVTVTDGQNTINDGSASNIYKLNGGNNILNLASSSDAASDAVQINGGSNTVNGTQYADNVNVSGGVNNILNLGAGDNNATISGGSQNTVNSGAGADSIKVSGGTQNTLDLGAGADNVTISGGTANNVDLGAGNDRVQVNSGAQSNTIVGGAGADIINANYGNNVIYGGQAPVEGQDYVASDSGKNTITLGSGDNVVYAGSQGDNISSNASGNVIINGAGGADTIDVSSSNNSNILGGAGNDIIHGGLNQSTINGGAGNDSLYANGINNTVLGGAGSDYIETNTDRTNASSATSQYADITAGTDNDIISLNKFVEETLHFYKGDGADRVINGKIPAGESEPVLTDTLVFDDSDFSDLTFSKNGNDLIITYSNAGDKVTVVDFYTLDEIRNTVKTLKTQDNTTGIDLHAYLNNGISVVLEPGEEEYEGHYYPTGATYPGTELNEFIIGTRYEDVIDGGAGNDNINGAGDDDLLSDSLGYNTIIGGTGMDTINAFSNGDYEGGNTIQFNEGDGEDSIVGYKTGNTATLRFPVSSFDDLRFGIKFDDLYYDEDNPEARIKNFVIYYSEDDFVKIGEYSKIDQSYDLRIAIAGDENTKTLDDLLAERNYVIDGIKYKETDKFVYEGSDATNDYIIGSEENNVLIGGKGNDTLDSSGPISNPLTGLYGWGDDEYIINSNAYVFDASGDGRDTILNSNISGNAHILFKGVGTGIDDTDAQIAFMNTLEYSVSGYNLVIKYGNPEAQNQITIVDYSSDYNRSSISGIKFYYPSDSAATIEDACSVEYKFSDYLYLISQVQEDTPFQGYRDYNQKINGTDGNDTISPGGSKNIITPGAGNDIIKFDRMYVGYDYYSTDIIPSYHEINMGTDNVPDTLQFNIWDWYDYDEDVEILNLTAHREGDDLVIVDKYELYGGSIDAITVMLRNYFTDMNPNQDPSFMKLIIGDEYSDQKIMTLADIYTSNEVDNTETGVAEVNGTVFNDAITLSAATEETVYAGKGNDTITAAGGNDTIYGGKGNDIINLNSTGNNTVVVSGEDAEFVETIKNSSSTDTLKFVEGLSGYKFSELAFEKSSDDLVIKTPDDGQIIIEGFYTSESKIDSIIALNNEDEATVYSISNDAIISLSDISDFVGTDSDEIIHLTKGDVNENEDVLHGDTYTSNATRTEYKVDAFALGKGGNDEIWGTDGNDWINGGSGNDTISGGVGNADSHDMLSGHDGNNLIVAGVLNSDNTYELTDGSAEMYAREGDDIVIGGNGNDYIDAGKGSNTLTGNGGEDIFVLRGGQDLITDATAEDIVAIIGTTNFADISFTRGENDSTSLILTYGENGRLELQNYFVLNDEEEYVMNANAVKTFVLLDAYSQNEYTLEWRQSNVTGEYSMYRIVEGTDADDDIEAIAGIKNWIDAGAGNDTVTGANSGDMLAGNSGDNTIIATNGAEVYGENGDDIVAAGGNNFIWTHGGDDDINLGATGNNTVALWDDSTIGNTTITGATATDTLKFNIGENGYKFSELAFEKSGNDLIINTPNDGKVTVEGLFASESKLDKVVAFDDEGVKADYSILENVVFNVSDQYDYVGTDYNEEIHLISGDGVNEYDDVLQGYTYTSNADNHFYAVTSYANAKGGDDKIFGSDYACNWINGGAGNDTITQGKAEHDMISGGDGNDSIIGNIMSTAGSEFYGHTGNDVIIASGGNDFIWGGQGDDEINLANGGSNKVMIADESEYYVETIKNSTANDILKLNYGPSGYKFSDLVFEKADNDLIVNTTTDNGQIVLEDFFANTSKLDSIMALDEDNNIKDDYSISSDAVINVALSAGGSTFNSESYNYNITNNSGNTTYNISTLAKSTLITDTAGADILNIAADKSNINVIFNITKNNSFAEGNNKLFLVDNATFNSWKDSGYTPTKGIQINGFNSIEVIKSIDNAQLVPLTQLKASVAAWLSQANGGAGYADVNTAIRSGAAEVSELIAYFENVNWQQ